MKSIVRILIISTLHSSLLLASNEGVNQLYQNNFNQWIDSNIDSYAYTLKMQCFCPINYTRLIRVEILDNHVSAANFVNYDEPVSIEIINDLESIDGWFNLISTAISRDADHISVEYDASYGYPTMIDIDMRRMRSDDEQVISISEFTLN